MLTSIFDDHALESAVALIDDLRQRCKYGPPAARPWLTTVELALDGAITDVRRARRMAGRSVAELLAADKRIFAEAAGDGGCGSADESR